MPKFNEIKRQDTDTNKNKNFGPYREQMKAIGNKVTKPCTSEWLALLLNALLFLFTANLPSRQTETAKIAGYWTCLQILL